MQSLATYSFEAVVEDVQSRLDSLNQLIDAWLVRKGATAPQETEGSFASKTGDGLGQFSRHVLHSKTGSLFELQLTETAHTGAMFGTRIQIAAVDNHVVVYTSLSATPGESRVAPVGLYPRCPHVVRSMIESFSDWKFEGQDVPLARAFDATDPDDAIQLCDALCSDGRRLPIVVVSNDEDEAVWPDFHHKVAEQLVGLADVAVVSAESSWVLTDELGQRNSCYLGAIRLYWPARCQSGWLPGINWIASKLASFGTDDAGKNRFLAILRREIMSVAALTMSPPAMFRDIRNSAEKERLLALEQDAQNRELDSIVEENSRLVAELEEAKQTIRSLQWKIASVSYAQRDATAANDETGDLEGTGSGQQLPQPGEIRFYKKIGSGGGVDSLVLTKACNHKESNWKPAFKGDQAEKGLLKLEGRNDWQSIAHCSACTGGGRWRVHW